MQNGNHFRGIFMRWQTLRLSLLANLDTQGWAAAPVQTLENAARIAQSERGPFSAQLTAAEGVDMSWKGMVQRFTEEEGLVFQIDEAASQVVFERKQA
jgi:hypothetical protein